MNKGEGKSWFRLFENVNFNFNFRIFVSILIVLTVPFLFLYRFFPRESLTEFRGFPNLRDFVYYTSVFTTPLILIIGFFLNAYKISYLPLVFVYSVDVIWVLNRDTIEHYSTLNLMYATLISLGCVVVYKALNHVKVFQNKVDQEAQETLEQIQKELDKLTSQDDED